MLSTTFNTGHALLLPGGRILRPQGGRYAGAQQPRKSNGAWPRQEPVPDVAMAKVKAQSRTRQEHEQSANAFSPRPRTWQHIVHDNEQASGKSSRDRATERDEPRPSSVRVTGMFTSANRPLPETGYRIRVSISPPTAFPVHIQHVLAYDLV